MSGQLMVQCGTKWIDVSDRKIIIYGAGQGCIDMMNDLQLKKIYAVIDSNQSIQGTRVVLQNKLFEIDAPELLNRINPNEFLIVISSIRYKEEIIRTLDEQFDIQYMRCIWDEMKYCYDTVEDLLILDPILNKKMDRFNLTISRYEIIKSAKKNIKLCFNDVRIDRFISIREGGSKLLFLFGNENKLWIYSVRGQYNTKNKLVMQKSENIAFSIRTQFIKENAIGDEITIYRDETGVLIQEYGTKIEDFGSKYIRKCVMRECRRIHMLNHEQNNLEESNFVDGFYKSYRELIDVHDKRSADILYEIDELAEKSITRLMKSGELKVIHGDLTYENIVLYNGKVSFIDWEFLSVGNPMIDLGMFVCSVNFNNKKKILPIPAGIALMRFGKPFLITA